jgi:hypothetical protein
MGVFALLEPETKAKVAPSQIDCDLGGKRGGALCGARLNRDLVDGGWITSNVVGPFISVPGRAGL